MRGGGGGRYSGTEKTAGEDEGEVVFYVLKVVRKKREYVWSGPRERKGERYYYRKPYRQAAY